MTHTPPPPAPLREIAPGSRWTSEARTLTEDELDLACKLSGDAHPIHADADFAAKTALGRRVFQGGWGAMVALGQSTHFPDLGTRNALALGIEGWRFMAPLFIGDVVHVEVEITGLRRTSDGLRVALKKQVRLVKNTGEIAQQGETASLVYLDAEDLRDGFGSGFGKVDNNNDSSNGDKT